MRFALEVKFMRSDKTNYKIISLGGSIVIPPEGFDIEFLKRFKNLIIERVKNGERFIIVVGGGSTARRYQKALGEAHEASRADLDRMGIFATHLNANFVRLMFGKRAHPEVVVDPTKKIIINKPIIIAGGWKPGCSTDYDAVLLAKTYGAKEIINASNISYVYTADPKLDPSAKSIPRMSWKELRAIVGDKWIPGANVPFDPKAAKEGEKLGLKVKFVKGAELSELSNVLEGKDFDGTIVD